MAVAVVLLLAAVAAMGGDRRGDAAAPPRTGVLVVDVVTGDVDRVARAVGGVAWSSDGRWLYRSGEPSGLNRPVRRFDTFDGAGSRHARVTLDAPWTGYGDVAVAAGGRRIAYVGAPSDPRQENFGDLIVATIAGQRPTRLLSRAPGTPAWSPTGSRVAVVRSSVADSRGGHGPAQRLVVVPVRGSGGRQTVARGVLDTPPDNPRWLRDGRLLVALSHGGQSDLITMRPDGRRRRVIARAIRAFGWEPSPDGRRLAIAGLLPGEVEQHLYIVDLAAGPPLRRLTDETVLDATWSPSGDRLAAISGDRILLIDPDRDQPAQVLVRVARRQLLDLAWSPDGTRLAISATVPPPPSD